MAKKIKLLNSEKEATVSPEHHKFINQFDWFVNREGYCRTFVRDTKTDDWQVVGMEYMVVGYDEYKKGFKNGEFEKVDLTPELIKNLIVL